MKEWLKKAGKWILEILETNDGVPSSKRIQSFLLFGFGIWLAFNGVDWQLIAVVFGAALGLQGVSSWTK